MELRWDEAERTHDTTYCYEKALRGVAAAFAASWKAGGFTGGVFYGELALCSHGTPRNIAFREFLWQEPYHTSDPGRAPEMHEAVVTQLLACLMA